MFHSSTDVTDIEDLYSLVMVKSVYFTHTHEYPDISMVFFLQIILSPTNGKTQFKKIMAPDIAFKNIHFFRILTIICIQMDFFEPNLRRTIMYTNNNH